MGGVSFDGPKDVVERSDVSYFKAFFRQSLVVWSAPLGFVTGEMYYFCLGFGAPEIGFGPLLIVLFLGGRLIYLLMAVSQVATIIAFIVMSTGM